MEAPRRIGPFSVLHTFGTGDEEAANGHLALHVALRSDANGAVEPSLLSTLSALAADDPACRVRFRAESEKSRRFAGPAAPVVVDTAPADAAMPWSAARYVPSVSLREALRAHGGPLPETAVRALGSALAHSLLRAHADGLVHTGIMSDNVQLTADGALVFGFGAARMTGRGNGSAEGSARGLMTGDGRTRSYAPADDIRAFGKVLVHAVAGTHRVGPETRQALLEVSADLRTLTENCLAQSPSARPTASALARNLGPLPGPGWLPEAVGNAVSHQAERVGATADEMRRHPASPPPVAGDAVRQPKTSLARRTLLVGGITATAGLALGGTVAYALNADGAPPARPRPRQPIPGVAPRPLWQYDLPGSAKASAEALVWRERVVVLPHAEGATGLDPHTGKKLWEDTGAPVTGTPLDLGRELVLLPGQTFKAVSARTGETAWSAGDFGSSDVFHTPLAAAADTLWILARAEKGYEVIAFDIPARERIWHSPVPRAPERTALLLPGALLLAEGKSTYRALDRKNGRELWKRTFEKIPKGETLRHVVTPGGRLVVAGTGSVCAYRTDADSGRKPVWTCEAGTEETVLGTPALPPRSSTGTLYVTDSSGETLSLAEATGDTRWDGTSPYQFTDNPHVPSTVLSSSGRTVLASCGASVDAYRARDGRALWHFTPVGSGRDKGYSGQLAGRAPGVVLVRSHRRLHALPVV